MPKKPTLLNDKERLALIMKWEKEYEELPQPPMPKHLGGNKYSLGYGCYWNARRAGRS